VIEEQIGTERWRTNIIHDKIIGWKLITMIVVIRRQDRMGDIEIKQ
jgi:hypothetical protein